MGCDIHLYAEKKVPHPIFWWKVRWVSIDKYSKNPDFGKWEGEPEYVITREDRIYTGGRNYNLFCALAGVRSYHFNGEPKCVSSPRGISNHCPEIMNEIERYGSDGHSHSWNTLAELENFDWSDYGKTCAEFLGEVLPKLRKVSRISRHDDVRVVYFFDN